MSLGSKIIALAIATLCLCPPDNSCGNLEKEDLKEFIKDRTNQKLQELGYEPIFDFDKKKAEKLEWFYHLTGGLTHTDFFAVRPTDYSKANEGEDWGDLF